MSCVRRLGLVLAVVLLTSATDPPPASAGEFSAAYQASLRRTM